MSLFEPIFHGLSQATTTLREAVAAGAWFAS
jgi:hypothetical protein